jgi:hypothetical protein
MVKIRELSDKQLVVQMQKYKNIVDELYSE